MKFRKSGPWHSWVPVAEFICFSQDVLCCSQWQMGALQGGPMGHGPLKNLVG